MTTLTRLDSSATPKATVSPKPADPSLAAPPFAIRKASRDDNEKLIDLARRCPMKGQLEMYSDRYPDFFAMNRIQGEAAHIYLAETAEGVVIGCAAFTEKSERRGDKDITVLHIGDLRTDPALRRGRIAAKLVDVYLDLLRSGRYDHGIVEMLEGNAGANALNKLLTDEMQLVDEGKMNFFQLLPIRSYRLSKAWNYRKANRDDMPAIIGMFDACYADAPGAPRFTIEWFEKQLSIDPSFSLDDLWVAADANNQAVAMIGLWDQSTFRRTIATKFTRGIRTAVRFLAMIGFVWKLPPAPREGQALTYVFGRWPIARPENSEALSNLCRFVTNRVHQGRKHQFLSVGFHERDPLAKSLEGITKVQERIEIYTHWIKDSDGYREVDHSPEGKRFVDLALI